MWLTGMADKIHTLQTMFSSCKQSQASFDFALTDYSVTFTINLQYTIEQCQMYSNLDTRVRTDSRCMSDMHADKTNHLILISIPW